ncbi:MAG: ribosome maturation factor RimM [Acidimicrobiales bacterium]|jgi:16S rRNA processing protein RimM
MRRRAQAPPGGVGVPEDALPRVEELLEVGSVLRPHGLSGEVVVALVTNRPERLEPGSLLYASGRELRIHSARRFSGRWLVRFEGVDDLEAAVCLRGVPLLARPLSDPEALWVHELIGSVVRSVAGDELGTVSSVLANPASDLLELEGGGLVPVRFVVEHGPNGVVVDVPHGLLG